MAKKKQGRIRDREKIIEDAIVELITKMYGPNARKVITHIIRSRGVVAEETLGKELGIKSNEARRILQKLAEEAIISYRKVRRDDRTIHGWILNREQLEGVLISRLKKTLDKLKTRLEYEENTILYECPVCGRRYSLDEAMDYDYMCPIDGAPLNEYDPSESIKVLKEKIKEIEADLAFLGAI